MDNFFKKEISIISDEDIWNIFAFIKFDSVFPQPLFFGKHTFRSLRD